MFVFQFGHTKPPSANHDSRFGYAMPSYFADACIHFCRRHVCFRGPPTLNHCCNMPHRNRIFSAAVHFLSVFFFVLFWITVHCRHVLNIRNGTYIARALLRCPFSSTSRSSSEWGNRSFFHFFLSFQFDIDTLAPEKYSTEIGEKKLLTHEIIFYCMSIGEQVTR